MLNQRKAGSVCQAAGWGYPRLAVPSPWPASSVNEILSPALQSDTQQRGGQGGRLAGSERLSNCIFIPFINLILPPSLIWSRSYIKACPFPDHFFSTF